MPESHTRSVSVERHIAAPPEKVFAVVADPAQHPVIDGSGMVRDAPADGPARLSLGAEFGMSMRWGMPYAMVNEVVESRTAVASRGRRDWPGPGS